jgi:hypothetical protein
VTGGAIGRISAAAAVVGAAPCCLTAAAPGRSWFCEALDAICQSRDLLHFTNMAPIVRLPMHRKAPEEGKRLKSLPSPERRLIIYFDTYMHFGVYWESGISMDQSIPAKRKTGRRHGPSRERDTGETR